jgi:hypothetical protein
MCFIFLYKFCKNVFLSGKYEYIVSNTLVYAKKKKMQVFMYSVHYCRWILTKIWICWQILVKLFSIKFHDNPFRKSWAVTCWQTDGRHVAKQKDRYEKVNRCIFAIFHCKCNKQQTGTNGISHFRFKEQLDSQLEQKQAKYFLPGKLILQPNIGIFPPEFWHPGCELVRTVHQ